MIEFRNSQGMLRTDVSEAELQALPAEAACAWRAYIDAHKQHADIGHSLRNKAMELEAARKTRDEAVAAVVRLSPTNEAARIAEVRKMIRETHPQAR